MVLLAAFNYQLVNDVADRGNSSRGAVWPDGYNIFKHLAIYINENLPNGIQSFAKVGQKFSK